MEYTELERLHTVEVHKIPVNICKKYREVNDIKNVNLIKKETTTNIVFKYDTYLLSVATCFYLWLESFGIMEVNVC